MQLLVKVAAFLILSLYLFSKMLMSMSNIVSNDKIELKYDKYEMRYILTVYDNYGHYIDDVILTKDEVKELYEGLEGVKNTF
jgi:hypothetical protein